MAEVNTFLDVNSLTKSIGDLTLVENASFSVAQRQKVALVGRNGTGKSTLLNIIGGKEGYDSGTIVYRKNIRIGYLEQTPSYSPSQSVLEACFSGDTEHSLLLRNFYKSIALGNDTMMSEYANQLDIQNAWDYESRIKEVLSKLEISDFDEKMGNLSGGQRKRVALANVLLGEPDMMILDEPTNHLDLKMIEWLEKYLSRPSVTLLMVTHDRYFLENVCNRIYEIDNSKIYGYEGSYSYYLEKRQERMETEQAEVSRAANLYRRELEWMRRMPQARGHKARYREENFVQLENKAHQPTRQQSMTLVANTTYIGTKILEISYVSKAFGKKRILNDFYYNFSRYEKVGIVGANGSGKSTFIKMILGYEQCDSGKINIGETVKFGYFAQEGMRFNDDDKVIDVVRNVAETIDVGGGKKISAMQFLQHFLFPPSVQNSYVRKLSGGERRRLYLCTVLMRNPNFLVLDEPTNDLDIETLQVLEEYLANFKGCLLIASHDRWFMDRTCDHLLVFKGDAYIDDFPGNYTQYRKSVADQERKNESEKRSESNSTKKVGQGTSKQNPQNTKTVSVRKLTYKERLELAELEKEIESLEKEKQDIITTLSGAITDASEITIQSKRLAECEKSIEEKSNRWLALSEIEEGSMR
jgi:ABC transport system ATP-binding/permease protein